MVNDAVTVSLCTMRCIECPIQPGVGCGNTPVTPVLCLRPLCQERLLAHLETLEQGEKEEQGGETEPCNVEYC